jgi:transcriptional regulator with PAS, ATPase and Fis domain
MWSLKNKNGVHASSSGLTATNKFFKNQHLNSDFILGAIDDGVMVVDKSNIIHVFNLAAGNITGWAPEEAVGRNFYEVLQMVDAQGAAMEPQQNPIIQSLVQGKPIRNSDCLIKSKASRDQPQWPFFGTFRPRKPKSKLGPTLSAQPATRCAHR